LGQAVSKEGGRDDHAEPFKLVRAREVETEKNPTLAETGKKKPNVYKDL